jgi:predicted acyl esterase
LTGADTKLSITGVDAYDCIEFIAKLDWCNGAITMAGNSWLATTQWSAAIQKPPSLKCIAPWEGFTDKYRDVACRGGVPKKDFVGFIFNKTIRGRQKREDLEKALDQWPLMNAFWQDKSLDTSSIDIPIYALASYCSGIHVAGTIRGFNTAQSKKKWLRIHPTQEWYDLYLKEANDDLQKFFDRYLKEIDNGWDETMPVRVSLLTYGDRNGPVSSACYATTYLLQLRSTAFNSCAL